ncbi:MAG: hypothetical protein JXA57_09815, partial [Armatimonadetes bacterium]|nr:hypothetical protein [Armatimonadota bacterium]
RETANDYKNKAVPAGPPYRVGWPVFFMGTSGHAYHVASITEVDPDGRDGWTIEARGRRWGVVRYRMSDPKNGVLARGGKVYRYPGIDLGELEEDDMTDEDRLLIRLARVSDVARSYDMEILKALVRGDTAKAEKLEEAKSIGVAKVKDELGLD